MDSREKWKLTLRQLRRGEGDCPCVFKKTQSQMGDSTGYSAAQIERFENPAYKDIPSSAKFVLAVIDQLECRDPQARQLMKYWFEVKLPELGIIDKNEDAEKMERIIEALLEVLEEHYPALFSTK